MISVTHNDFAQDPKKYLNLAYNYGNVAIVKDGANIAVLTEPPREKKNLLKSLAGLLPPAATVEEAIEERIRGR